MLYFIRVYTIGKDKIDLQKTFFFVNYNLAYLDNHVQWIIPSSLYQIKRKNPLVYKGLITLGFIRFLFVIFAGGGEGGSGINHLEAIKLKCLV